MNEEYVKIIKLDDGWVIEAAGMDIGKPVDIERPTMSIAIIRARPLDSGKGDVSSNLYDMEHALGIALKRVSDGCKNLNTEHLSNAE
tara:strand:+ start:161 stop:421 length:261 start_codon:yes stop_codon:yes gene_type:complete